MEIPVCFRTNMRNLLGGEEYASFEKSLSETPPTSIRYNTRKNTSEARNIEQDNDNISIVEWCPNAYYLDNRPTFTFDPLFHAGCYYVQEASSMYLSKIISTYIKEPSLVLDLCAAPGGKSTLALSQLPEGSMLIANEVIRQRASILAENIAKWGYPNTIVTNNYAEKFQKLGLKFDAIIADVPCSGEGMFRKDEDSIKEWSEDNVEMCSKRQREIITDIWPCLKPDGILIYSTCTYNTKENEENILWIIEELGGTPLPVHFSDKWNIKGSMMKDIDTDVCHFMPHINKGEGFFIAAIRKNRTEKSDSYNDNKGKKKKNSQSFFSTNKDKIKEVSNWILSPEDFKICAMNEKIIAIPHKYIEVIEQAYNVLNVISCGITMAIVKGKDAIPTTTLALSNELNTSAFPSIEVSYEDAISFLRCDCLHLQPSVPKGYIIITYKSQPLGFVKNIGTRANNLYPQEWKIRSSRMPENIVLPPIGGINS